MARGGFRRSLPNRACVFAHPRLRDGETPLGVRQAEQRAPGSGDNAVGEWAVQVQREWVALRPFWLWDCKNPLVRCIGTEI